MPEQVLSNDPGAAPSEATGAALDALVEEVTGPVPDQARAPDEPASSAPPAASSTPAPALTPTDRPPSAARAPRPRPRTQTVWERGRHPGRLVVRAITLGTALVAALDVVTGGGLGLLFDLTFVLLCVVAGLWVRRRDFFMVGVLPPLLMGAVVATLAVLDPGAVARAGDPIVQAFVSGLAHHATALVVGYGLTLLLLSARQVALRHDGVLRLGRR